MYDIITIGSATRDVFIKPEESYVDENERYKTGKAVCFSFESKIDASELHFFTGGSAANSAITFARQGLQVAALCRIGDDSNGQSIIARLEEEGVSIDFIFKDSKYLTAYAVVIVASGGRTELVHRGATEHLCCDEPIPYEKLKDTKWFYITNLGGESGKIFSPLIDFAYKNNIKIALNPGKAQLKLGQDLIHTLNKSDILIVNQEEASQLTGIPFKDEADIFKKLDEWVKGIAVMTKGPLGFSACDNNYMYSSGILKEQQYVDRTGAGDAFGAGLVAGIIKGMSLEKAFQLASANATSVLGELGANHGLLSQGEDIYKFGKLNINKKNCLITPS